ncbi:Holliday junction branch migration protein RuvA [Robiginitomaculum antarcticum]|uniref:Holliday junction branch migration protein RuvA n=1 Tax=Robiginitomaculum antarcticum TaxID=437507 RepID=UPI00035D24B9|nr:Holliday junction branch migration protein RuvA [Robiginitomaculum antarcticum]
MIGMLSGTCLFAGSGEAIIDCGGVGYLVLCGSRTLAGMGEGAAARLHIETHVRETAITLYGFGTEEERAWFVRLQSVQGVGPKAALAILDILTPGQILSAASLEDKASFSRASGVGPKLAARIAIELSGKPAPTGRMVAGAFTAPSASASQGEAARTEGLSDMGLRNDAVSALVNLGIDQSSALRAVAQAYAGFADDPALDDLIKAALKEMSRERS